MWVTTNIIQSNLSQILLTGLDFESKIVRLLRDQRIKVQDWSAR